MDPDSVALFVCLDNSQVKPKLLLEHLTHPQIYVDLKDAGITESTGSTQITPSIKFASGILINQETKKIEFFTNMDYGMVVQLPKLPAIFGG